MAIITDIELSNFLKIQQIGSFVRNLNTSSVLWSEYFKPYFRKNFEGRQLQYLTITSLGIAAVKAAAADGSGLYPKAKKPGTVLATASCKEWDWTVSIPRQILSKEAGLESKYAETMVTDLDNKQIANSLLKSVELLGDGSGSLGVIESVTVNASNNLVITLSKTSANAARSNVRWFFEEDEVVIHDSDGTAHNQAATGTDVAYWEVSDRDYDDWTVELIGRNSAGTKVNAVSGQINAVAGDLIYREGSSIPNLDTFSADYETLSYAMVGLESLAANDGRTVHGLVKSGNLAGTRMDFNGAVLESKLVSKLFNRGLDKVGEGQYNYEKNLISSNAWLAISEANEVDRRFSVNDNGERGFSMLGLKHRKHKLEYCNDRFIHDSRMYILPKADQGMAWEDAPLSFIGDIPKQVDPNKGSPYMLSIAEAGGRTGYGKENVTFFEQQGVAIVRHAAAIMIGENFELPTL